MNKLNILLIIICSFTISMSKILKSKTKLKGIDEACKKTKLNGHKFYYKCAKIVSTEAFNDETVDEEGGEFWGEGYIDLNSCIGYGTVFLGLGQGFEWKKDGNYYTDDGTGTGCHNCTYNWGVMKCDCRVKSMASHSWGGEEIKLNEHIKHNIETGHLYCDL